ncbi:MAG TPA: methyltransferase [Ruminococcus sp.]|nr:methyltransferase [Ruminococcus sp.]
MKLICPVCGKTLTAEKSRFFCEKGHSFDRAKSGYVNLLQRQKHRQRGDDAAMAAARRQFLNAGYYQPLLDAISQEILDFQTKQIADIGCGEGWYSCGVLQQLLHNGGKAELAGFDISPEILRFAANRAKECAISEHTLWAAASVNRIPLPDAACDCVMNLFAPCEPHEFARVLCENGILIRAIPMERHLWEMKCAIYEKPYENRPVPAAPDGFRLLNMRQIDFEITVPNADLQALFAMTPYVHKTAPSDAAKLLHLDRLKTQISFGLLVCKKDNGTQ